MPESSVPSIVVTMTECNSMASQFRHAYPGLDWLFLWAGIEPKSYLPVVRPAGEVIWNSRLLPPIVVIRRTSAFGPVNALVHEFAHVLSAAPVGGIGASGTGNRNSSSNSPRELQSQSHGRRFVMTLEGLVLHYGICNYPWHMEHVTVRRIKAELDRKAKIARHGI